MNESALRLINPKDSGMQTHLHKAVVMGTLLTAVAASHAALVTVQGTRTDLMGTPPSGLALEARNTFANSSPVNVVATDSFTRTPQGSFTQGFSALAGNASIGCQIPSDGQSDPIDTCRFQTALDNGRFNTSGDSGPYLGSTGDYSSLGPIIITFAGGGFSAFGFYATDLGDFGDSMTLSLKDFQGNVSTLEVVASGPNGQTDGNLMFFGFYDDTGKKYQSVSFLNEANQGDTRTPDGFAIDDLIVGNFQRITPPTSVPEPMSALLVLLGLAAAGKTQRRRS